MDGAGGGGGELWGQGGGGWRGREERKGVKGRGSD